MIAALTLFLALIASSGPPGPRPEEHNWRMTPAEREGIAHSTIVVDSTFIGREWKCGKTTCFAGYEFGFDDAAGLVWSRGD